ncbi:MAG: DNA mismatch repair protein MutS [Deltaproteobacteria bacterium]|nr:DNA mismatch repair protein MutS [Deltaproteobacteria bacterium]
MRELASRAAFREDLALLGRRVRSSLAAHDPAAPLRWASERGESIPVVIALVLVLATLVLGGLSAAGLAWATRPFGGAVLAQVVLGVVLRGRTEAVLGPIATRHSPLGGYPAVLARAEREPFEAARLAALAEVLRGGGGAARALSDLDVLLGFAAVRHNALIQVVANVFLSWDVFAAARLEGWRRRHGADVARWLEALAELEALTALGTFAAEHPDYAWPRVEPEGPRFVARGLGHPLVAPRSRVTNDVSLDRVRALMITGSNMSGKSTMLRSMGVAAVLAQVGAPVCADDLVMSELRVWTSMRIDDSLATGASHFFAEVRRLKAVVDAVREPGRPVFFLLDEVLHGTNSRERILGAKAVVRHLVDRGAIGAVSSHDLGLVALEGETAGEVVNVHFQEHVADGTMGFDYRMRPGPVATSNALRLMRQVGIDVVPCDDDARGSP